MTDKQINVTKCIHFEPDIPNGCTCYWDGECNHNCYYKKYVRKKQECKALRKEKAYTDMACEQFKKQLQAKEQECEALQMSDNEAREIVAELKAECEELRRSVLEIFACLIKANKNEIVDTIWFDDITTLWDYMALTLGIEGDQTQVEKQILQKISEVLNDR